MEYNHYYLPQYQKKEAPQPLAAAGDSLDDLLSSDSHLLLDKVVHNAFSIVYRLRIYKDTTYELDHTWGDLKTQIHSLDAGPLGNSYSHQRKSTLERELLSLEHKRREEKLLLWKDLNYVTNELIEQFHKYQSQKQEQKLLGGYAWNPTN